MTGHRVVGEGPNGGVDRETAAGGTTRTGPARPMEFATRRWVRPEDLNPGGTLFGGSVLRWVDEEAAIYAILQLGSHRVVTKYISAVEFRASARLGDLVEIGLSATRFGRTSLTMRAAVRNMVTRESIVTVEEMVFVTLGPDGRPVPHRRTTPTEDRDRVPRRPLLS